ncbi:MAG: hypothetical protein QM527_05535 [Alphaproteobacteria bacterium]|nr:hypothetical protein [Alphaproteobacteria bacterium]
MRKKESPIPDREWSLSAFRTSLGRMIDFYRTGHAYRLGQVVPPVVDPNTVAPTHPVVLVTCGFGGVRYQEAAQRLARQAQALNTFTDIRVYTDLAQVPNLSTALAGTLQQWAARHPRGWGLWAWKPVVLGCVMQTLPEGAEVFYMDAGCEISPLGGPWFTALRQHLWRHGCLFFHMPFLERNWTHPMVLRHFHRPPDDGGGQIQATWFGLLNTATNRLWVQQWQQACLLDDGRLLAPQGAEPTPHLWDHRHDQSVLSCLVKQQGWPTLPHQDFFTQGLYYPHSPVLRVPVHALRQAGQDSQLDVWLASNRPPSAWSKGWRARWHAIDWFKALIRPLIWHFKQARHSRPKS